MVEPLALGTFPTPLESAPRLADALGLGQLWIKRDDLIGLGGGGNKARKLRFTCAEALAAGATALVTTGAPQSNHARATAAAAARLGLPCVLVLAGSAPARTAGNLLLDELVGAEVVWSGDRTPGEVAAEQVAARPGAFLIPFGGSSRTAVRAYVECARELTEQASFDHVVVAVGSGATMAGLVAGLGAARVRGVDVGAVADPDATVRALLPDDTGELLIDRGQVGAGYATVTDQVRAALRLAAAKEGLFLDPTYTGRAMAGLAAAAEPGSRVVFLHTGGLPGLFAADPAVIVG
ncbi:D-cysteine desulfhydrase [Actinoplanes lutulentus]|uniref:D-cysteine desulfhydrase n=1 Tax=Actinoplanes lutulentus TaxID=1287878 RepID=A0A327Z2H7_9ACTN|nr:pyridoxal-phosphate dependent enzyme [Actinoplanes lutulentus]MBB2940321.1 D-cysteine desulfhydrase [Actinoplanes lutulentus]RAK28814.1 D-cysteine desulfhydrase [Actinoplanes lutulentus]